MRHDLRHCAPQPPASDLDFSIPGKLTMKKSKRRKASENNRTINATWVDSFAFTADETLSAVCLICSDKLANENDVYSVLFIEKKRLCGSRCLFL